MNNLAITLLTVYSTDNTEDRMGKTDNACFLLIVNTLNKNESTHFITLLTFRSSAYFEMLLYLFILKHSSEFGKSCASQMAPRAVIPMCC